MNIELIDPEGTIENEIKQGGTQTDIAKTYYFAIKSSVNVDWKRINKAIIERWSISGLNRVKTMAWNPTKLFA